MKDALNIAKNNRVDEFYTRYEDISVAISKLLEQNPGLFVDKTILCPCDNPELSNFTKYFSDNFDRLGLKKLISTCYSQDEENFPLFSDNNKGMILEVTGGSKTYGALRSDGDFRSREVSSIRDSADFVITNPPFSLFREFFKWCIGTKFLLIGSINAVTYKDVFPYIKDNKAWVWNGFGSDTAYFSIGKAVDCYSYSDGIYDEGSGFVKFNNCCWFTNIDVPERHKVLPLSKSISCLQQIRYDHFDAIDIGKVADIPYDYFGVMGVPVSFLEKYNPEQFEIVGLNGIGSKWYGTGPKVNGKKKYQRVMIRRK